MANLFSKSAIKQAISSFQWLNIDRSQRLSMNEEAELMGFFETKKSEIVMLKSKIDVTDREIDVMVFELYGLSEEERRVVLDS